MSQIAWIGFILVANEENIVENSELGIREIFWLASAIVICGKSDKNCLVVASSRRLIQTMAYVICVAAMAYAIL